MAIHTHYTRIITIPCPTSAEHYTIHLSESLKINIRSIGKDQHFMSYSVLVLLLLPNIFHWNPPPSSTQTDFADEQRFSSPLFCCSVELNHCKSVTLGGGDALVKQNGIGSEVRSRLGALQSCRHDSGAATVVIFLEK